MNIVVIDGNLTGDPRAVGTSERAITEFTIAHHRRGNVTEFFPVTVFGAEAKRALALVKGQEAIVSGELRHPEWVKDGEKRDRFKIDASQIKPGRLPKERRGATPVAEEQPDVG